MIFWAVEFSAASPKNKNRDAGVESVIISSVLDNVSEINIRSFCDNKNYNNLHYSGK